MAHHRCRGGKARYPGESRAPFAEPNQVRLGYSFYSASGCVETNTSNYTVRLASYEELVAGVKEILMQLKLDFFRTSFRMKQKVARATFAEPNLK